MIKNNTKTKTTLIQTRLDTGTKDKAEAILAELGLTIPDVFRIIIMKIINDKGLNFTLTLPSQTHIEAINQFSDTDILKIEKVLDSYYHNKTKSTTVSNSEQLQSYLDKLNQA